MKSKDKIHPAHIVEIVTPKKFLLNGLWFGPYTKSGKPKKPKRVIIWVHGLTSSAFSRLPIVRELISRGTAVLTFSNRGHDVISRLPRIDGTKGALMGKAHEVFTECVDDIQGAIDFVRRAGGRQIYLAGHSTGCQKSIYWASKKKTRGIAGIILLAPLSDYADAATFDSGGRLARATRMARALVRGGKPHQLLPYVLWPGIADAQRFLSLHTPDSIEQSIFPYFDTKRKPKIFASIRKPVLVLLAEKDEYADRPAKKIAAWFKEHARSRRFELKIVPGVGHSFKGAEKQVADHIKGFVNSL
ncbi:MAG: alpha/beta fold hydrolase [Patescibacteria group bacterium]